MSKPVWAYNGYKNRDKIMDMCSFFMITDDKDFVKIATKIIL